MKLLQIIIPVALATVALCSPQSETSDIAERDLDFQDVTISFGRRDSAPQHEVMLAKRCHMRHKRHHRKRKGGSWKPSKFTWYSGHDLKNPSCQRSSRWNPTDNAMVAATTLHGWGTRPACGLFVKICSGSNGSGKCTFVRVVDSCEGCEGAHLDLTKKAFSTLKNLDVGVFTGSFAVMPPGFKPGAWSESKWGPQQL